MVKGTDRRYYRVHQLNQKLPDNVAAENAERKKDIAGLFESISQDLDGINAQRYQRQVSGAIQEYIEAVSLEHYITNQALIAPQEASKLIAGGVQLIGDDYLLGIFDLTGELMRFAITQMATLGSLPGLDASDSSANDPRIAGMENIAPGRNILMDLRLIRAYFESLDTSKAGASAGLGKDIEKKMEVMKTCVEKVENAAYGMFIRGRERPKGWVPVLKDDRTDAPEPVESY